MQTAGASPRGSPMGKPCSRWMGFRNAISHIMTARLIGSSVLLVVPALALALACSATTATRADDNDAQRATIEGRWVVRSVQDSREDADGESTADLKFIEICEGQFLFLFGNSEWTERFAITVDNSGEQLRIDLLTQDLKPTLQIRGIAKLEEGQMRLCLSDACLVQDFDSIVCGPIQFRNRRPAKFDPTAGILIQCERE